MEKDQATGKARIIQTNSYYPFGSRQEANNFTSGLPNKYLYNGKELQEETNYFDYGARTYDPEIARWIGIDPLAANYVGISPYVYVANNPLKFIDPNGREIATFDKKLEVFVSLLVPPKEEPFFKFTDYMLDCKRIDEGERKLGRVSQNYKDLQSLCHSETKIEISFSDFYHIRYSPTGEWFKLPLSANGKDDVGFTSGPFGYTDAGPPYTSIDDRLRVSIAADLAPSQTLQVLVHQLLGHGVLMEKRIEELNNKGESDIVSSHVWEKKDGERVLKDGKAVETNKKLTDRITNALNIVSIGFNAREEAIKARIQQFGASPPPSLLFNLALAAKQ